MTTTINPPIYDRAIAEIPEYAEAKAVQARIAETLAQIVPVNVGAERSRLRDGAEADLLAGVPVDVAALGRALTNIDARFAAAQAAETALRSISQAQASAAQVAIASGADDALDLLRAELSHVLDRARDIDRDLGTATDAESAIATGKADQWRDLHDLVDRHTQLRAAQAKILRAVDSTLGDLVQSVGTLRNWDQIDPVTIARRDDTKPAPVDPWPDEPIAWLRWAVASDADPWLPSIKELCTRHAEIEAAIQAAARERSDALPTVPYEVTDTPSGRRTREIRDRVSATHTANHERQWR